MINGVAGLIFRRERTSTPCASSSPISSCNAAGDSTTPLPIRHNTPSRRIPDGIRCRTVFLPLMTSVWPALCPPWKRATAPTRSVSRSTILPLPSSPHCAPRITTDLPMSPFPIRLCSKSIFLNKYPQRDHADQHHHAADDAQLARVELAHVIGHPFPHVRRGEQKQPFKHE